MFIRYLAYFCNMPNNPKFKRQCLHLPMAIIENNQYETL